MGLSHSTQRVLVVCFLASRVYLSKKNDGEYPQTVLNMLSTFFEKYPVVADIVGLFLLNEIRYAIRYGLRVSFKDIYDTAGQRVYQFLQVLAPSEVKKVQDKIADDLRSKLKAKDRQIVTAMAQEGRSAESILEEMQGYYQIDCKKWNGGKVSGAVYHGGDRHVDLLNKASNLYHVTNPLHADLFPSVMKFEAEICAMTASMMSHGNKDVCGSVLSGGTESIIMAAKSHRNWAEKEKGITRPEIVCCVTAHAAIDKACEMLGIRLIKVRCDPKTFKVDVAAVKRALTNDTIMIYSSAPNFPSGIIDPISDLSEIAYRHGCGLHVDCCLGGFYLPFLRQLPGMNVPDFDFKLRGVTTMSCDTHKFGYATKGTSVLLFKNKDLRHHMYFTYPQWTGGLYVTPSTAGSRPGSLIAACWASMVAMGNAGYVDATRKINQVVVGFRDAVRAGQIPGISLCGEPIAMIVAIQSSQFNIYTLSDKMAHKGYSLSNCQKPAMVHICFTLLHTHDGVLDTLLNDLKVCANECIAEAKSGAKLGGNAPVYGMAESLPEGPVQEMLHQYTDIVLEC